MSKIVEVEEKQLKEKKEEFLTKLLRQFREELRKSIQYIKPTVYFVPTDFSVEETEDGLTNFARLVNEAGFDWDRNRVILKHLLEFGVSKTTLVIGENHEHLKLLMNIFCKEVPYLRAGLLTGRVSKKQRKTIIADMKIGEVDILFATYQQLQKEAFELPELERLFLVVPRRDRSLVKWCVGRVMLATERKIGAVVFDFYDKNVKAFHHQAKIRAKEVYKELGCYVIDPPSGKGR